MNCDPERPSLEAQLDELRVQFPQYRELLAPSRVPDGIDHEDVAALRWRLEAFEARRAQR